MSSPAVDRILNEYFRGPRAALIAVLEDSLSWEAKRYADQAGIREIRFRKQEETDQLASLEVQFGCWGARLYQLARGIYHHPVVPNRIRKQISAEDTFPTDNGPPGKGWMD